MLIFSLEQVAHRDYPRTDLARHRRKRNECMTILRVSSHHCIVGYSKLEVWVQVLFKFVAWLKFDEQRLLPMSVSAVSTTADLLNSQAV
jgi:hypothetical protein